VINVEPNQKAFVVRNVSCWSFLRFAKIFSKAF